MSQIPLIDTHAGFKRLIEAGVPESQAEAHVRLFAEWSEQRLVTREYLDARLAELEKRVTDQLTRRLIAVVGVGFTLFGIFMAVLLQFFAG